MSNLVKRSLSISGHQTSVTLEEAFWQELVTLAAAEGVPVSRLVARIDETRTGNLSSAIRLYILYSLKEKARQ